MMGTLRQLLAATFALLILATGLLVAWFNPGLVRFDYIAGVIETRLVFVLFGALAVGCLLGLIGGFAAFLRQRREAGHLRARIRQLESELDSLRAAAVREIR